ncbi:MAG: hypothetical protein ACP5TV_02540 [Anaerolineae bacterium]
MNPERFRYRITIHTLEDILARAGELGLSAGEPAPVIYCDTQGRCMFDAEAGHPYLLAMESILNEAAGRGRRLVQIVFREQQMIAIWEEDTAQEA